MVGRQLAGGMIGMLIAVTVPEGVHAEYLPLPLVSSGFVWEASVDGVNWIPAYPEYPNNVTVPYPSTTEGVLMWYWDIANGNPTGTNGPNVAYFRAEFMLTDLHDDSAGAWIAADDWMELSVNGTSVATYYLSDHQAGSDRQPVPEFVDFTDQLNTRYQGDLSGFNTITIEAHDGGENAYNRVYEWLFFDALNVSSTPVLGSLSGSNGSNSHPVPEPSTFMLVAVGLVAVWGIKRRS